MGMLSNSDFEKKLTDNTLMLLIKYSNFYLLVKIKFQAFMREQLKGLDRDHGNVDLLSHRLSNVRTWSYVANKKNWVEIQIIGFSLLKVQRINYQISYTMSLQKVSLIKK